MTSSSAALGEFRWPLTPRPGIDHFLLSYNRQGWKDLLFTGPSLDSATISTTTPLTTLFPPTSSAQHSPTSQGLGLSDFPPSDFSLTSTSSTIHSRRDSPIFDRERTSRAPSSAFSSPPPSRASYSKERPDVPDYAIKKNYRLNLPSKTAAGGAFKPSVWLQGSCEATHGISDSLLRCASLLPFLLFRLETDFLLHFLHSVLAVRSGEVVESLRQEGWFGDE